MRSRARGKMTKDLWRTRDGIWISTSSHRHFLTWRTCSFLLAEPFRDKGHNSIWYCIIMRMKCKQQWITKGTRASCMTIYNIYYYSNFHVWNYIKIKNKIKISPRKRTAFRSQHTLSKAPRIYHMCESQSHECILFSSTKKSQFWYPIGDSHQHFFQLRKIPSLFHFLFCTVFQNTGKRHKKEQTLNTAHKEP